MKATRVELAFSAGDAPLTRTVVLVYNKKTPAKSSVNAATALKLLGNLRNEPADSLSNRLTPLVS